MVRSDGGCAATGVARRHGSGVICWSPAGLSPYPFERRPQLRSAAAFCLPWQGGLQGVSYKPRKTPCRKRRGVPLGKGGQM